MNKTNKGPIRILFILDGIMNDGETENYVMTDSRHLEDSEIQHSS